MYSKTSEYALRTLIFMAKDETKMHSAAYLHKQLKIPKKYLQQLLTQLSKKKLIVSTRGKYGGFMLNGSSKEIYLSDIIEATDGFNEASKCIFGFEDCALETPCVMHDIWASTQSKIQKKVKSARLSDIAKLH